MGGGGGRRCVKGGGGRARRGSAAGASGARPVGARRPARGARHTRLARRPATGVIRPLRAGPHAHGRLRTRARRLDMGPARVLPPRCGVPVPGAAVVVVVVGQTGLAGGRPLAHAEARPHQCAQAVAAPTPTPLRAGARPASAALADRATAAETRAARRAAACARLHPSTIRTPPVVQYTSHALPRARSQALAAASPGLAPPVIWCRVLPASAARIRLGTPASGIQGSCGSRRGRPSAGRALTARPATSAGPATSHTPGHVVARNGIHASRRS